MILIYYSRTILKGTRKILKYYIRLRIDSTSTVRGDDNFAGKFKQSARKIIVYSTRSTRSWPIVYYYPR